MSTLKSSLLLALVLNLASAAGATEPPKLLVFPTKGQTPDQQAKDQSECSAAVVKQTGFDPAAPPAPPPTQQATEEPKKQGGARLKGAARGAAAGAVVGEVANNDADEGAAVGAAVGVVAAGRQSRKQQAAAQEQAAAAQEKAQADAAATQTAKFTTHNNGMAACLGPRGYSVTSSTN